MKEYQDDKSINNRPRVEISLIKKFDRARYIAILIYILYHWEEMYDVEKGLACDDIHYPARFKYRIWYNLALILFIH